MACGMKGQRWGLLKPVWTLDNPLLTFIRQARGVRAGENIGGRGSGGSEH